MHQVEVKGWEVEALEVEAVEVQLEIKADLLKDHRGVRPFW